MIVAEAVILAIVGAVAGCLLGWALAQAALLAVGETVRNLFSSIGLSEAACRRASWPSPLASAVGVALFAALHPAVEATTISARWKMPGKPSGVPCLPPRNLGPLRLGFLCLVRCAAAGFLGAASLAARFGSLVPASVGMLMFLLGLAFFSPLMFVSFAASILAFARRFAWGFLGGDASGFG